MFVIKLFFKKSCTRSPPSGTLAAVHKTPQISCYAAALGEAQRVLAELSENSETVPFLQRVGARLRDLLKRRGRAFVCGNGGSLADAIHFAEEWTGRYRKDREPLPVIALADPAHITCVGNDYGFEEIFARPILALGHPGDMLFALSTSGNSRNLVRAAEAAKTRQVHVVGLLGRGGGTLKPLCDDAIVVPGATADRIQELHMMLLHILIEGVERDLYPEHYA